MLDILDDAKMLGCRPCDTQVVLNWKVQEDDGERLIDVGRYQRLVRKLIYLFFTRPDISYVVGLMSPFYACTHHGTHRGCI